MLGLLAWFKALSVAGKASVLVASAISVGTVAAATSNPQAPPPAQQAVAAPVITQETVTTTEEIPYTTSYVDNATLAKGSTKITTQGVNGVRTYTYEVTYADKVETSRKETSNVVTTQPINQVVAVGTYEAPPQPSCPSGTYVNSAGNTVCSPYSSSSAPAGATAECVDGTYSFSQSRRGTCSHHGGVATWL